jgi:hypothetical protein
MNIQENGCIQSLGVGEKVHKVSFIIDGFRQNLNFVAHAL